MNGWYKRAVYCYTRVLPEFIGLVQVLLPTRKLYHRTTLKTKQFSIQNHCIARTWHHGTRTSTSSYVCFFFLVHYFDFLNTHVWLQNRNNTWGGCFTRRWLLEGTMNRMNEQQLNAFHHLQSCWVIYCCTYIVVVKGFLIKKISIYR